jgi:arabinose-5-phosphate isomerase
LEAAAEVLRVEGAAVTRFAAELPADFLPVVETILNAEGRVILAGVGKSGHIARKIAATLASTGTPSYFVHPTEASHGDLGIITRHDICILISNSGETSELGDLISHTRRFSIPLIAISSRADSTLMRAADLKLLLPDAPEACPIGMAPTTSTTLTLALGDALAVALMEERGFVAENFRDFHPGGKLGARLALVHQLMHPHDQTPIVRADQPMSETLIEMTEKGFGIACVVEAGALVGVISDGDLRRNMADLMARTAGEVATRAPKSVPPTMLAAEALRIMNETKVNALVVVDEARTPIGLLRIHDCLRAGVV